jgi:hypothetical protein
MFLLILVFAAASVFLGEIPLVLGYILIPISVLTRWPESKGLRWATILFFGLALLLHLAGFKLVGSATVADLESLRKPRRISALVPPHTIRFQDGSTATVGRIFFPQVIEVTNPPYGHYESFRAFHNVRVLVERDKQPPIGIQVEIAEPTNNTTGAIFLRKTSYGCGNTWSPRFFPRRLPRQVRADLGPILITAGLALPTAEQVTNSRGYYYDPLLEALQDAVIPNLPEQHPEVERLALALLARHNWTQGLELLTGIGATNALSTARTHILKEPLVVKQTNRNEASPIAWNALLQKIDPTVAREALLQLLLAPELDVERGSLLAGSMAELGDISGFDLLTAHLSTRDMNSEPSRRFSRRLQTWFRFDIYLNGGGCPDDLSKEFLEWYREVRSRLFYQRLPTGRQGFALDQGIPFDAAYYRSMEPFKDRIARRHGRTIFRYRFYDAE